MCGGCSTRDRDAQRAKQLWFFKTVFYPPPVHPIVRLLSTDPKRVVGLMSGTSRSDIDAALCEIAGHGPDARADGRVALGFTHVGATRQQQGGRRGRQQRTARE